MYANCATSPTASFWASTIPAWRLSRKSAAWPRACGSESTPTDAYEKMLISEALADCGGSVTATADALRVPRKTLYDKLKKHKLGNGRALEQNDC